MDKIKRVKTWGLVLFYLAFYVPVYRIVVGSIYFTINVSALNGSAIMNSVSLAVVLFALIAIHLRPSLLKVAEIVALIVMSLMVILLIILKTTDPDWSLNYGFIVMVVGLVFFATAKFVPTIVEKAYDVTCGFTQKITNTLKENESEQPVVENIVAPIEEAKEPETDEEPNKQETFYE
jgi:Sec-independent protein translocase protein TatA